MTWEKVKLGDCCTSITDGDHQAPPVSESGIPFIIISDIDSFNQINFDHVRYVPIDYYNKLSVTRKPKLGDILYTVKGSFGIPALVRENTPFTFQRDIAILRPLQSVSSKFLYYLMKSKAFYHQADSVAIGSAQRAITLSALRDMEVHLPERKVQDKIASILSAYDDLIENNRRQMKLLEEAAERLYKEWFVKFHYPGSGNAAGPDNLPVGWNRILVKDITEIKTGKRDANFSTNDGKFPFFTCSDEMLKADSYSFSGNAVILAGNGNFRVRIFRGNFEAYQRTYVMQPFEGKYIYLLYWSIKNSINTLINGASGSTILFLKKAMIENISVIIPSPMILLTFNNYMSRIQLALEDKYEEIALLQEARDRLLPKLMSGEVEV